MTSIASQREIFNVWSEVHKLELLFRLMEWMGEAVFGSVRTMISAGFTFIVPVGTKHNIINTGNVLLGLFTLYDLPNHRYTIHHTLANAGRGNEHFD
jgi:mannose-6-phosphate isomerase-like protein (cupin superfamily)